MKILVYYNVLHKNLTTIFEEHSIYHQLGDFYKVNSQLVSIMDISDKQTPIKIIKKNYYRIIRKIGNLLILTGEKLTGKSRKSKLLVIEKKIYPWWK